MRRPLGLVPALVLVLAVAPPAEATTHGAQLWSSRFVGPNFDAARSIATSPDGREIYVTGLSWDGPRPYIVDAVTVAYDASTGGELWAARFDAGDHGIEGGSAIGFSVVAAPTGSTVYVGLSVGGPGPFDMHGGVVAYGSSTGRELWVNDEAGFEAVAMALAPDGTSLVLLGTDADRHVATEDFEASSGRTVWRSTSGLSNVQGRVVTFVPGRDMVVETLQISPEPGVEHTVAVALDAGSGEQLWSTQVASSSNGTLDDLAATPDGSSVFITGSDDSAGTGSNYLTTALDPTSGSVIWSTRLSGPKKKNQEEPLAITVNAKSTRVFVTGLAAGDYLTVAYRVKSGTQLWATAYDGGGHADYAEAIGVSPGGGTVFVTGESPDVNHDQSYATVAYSAASGAQLWASRYQGTGWRDAASALAVSPSGDRVFVTGKSAEAGTRTDYATVAYAA